MRKLPLLVLIYEGIVQKVFEYDYAPESTMVKNTRLYLNVSQEGVDDLDDLIEGELIRGLRLKSTEHQSVLAFQITTAGLALVSKRMSEENRQLVDELSSPMGSFCKLCLKTKSFTCETRLSRSNPRSRTSKTCRTSSRPIYLWFCDGSAVR